jgi:hypothetical protein
VNPLCLLKLGSLLAFVLIVGSGAAACGQADPHPGELEGAWREIGLDREIVLGREGDFRFLESGATKGSGTWQVDERWLVIELSSGLFRWQHHTVVAPATVSRAYAVKGSFLTIYQLYEAEYERVAR